MNCNSKKTYPVIGVILEIKKETNELLIKHDEIKNFMMAMTMPFNVKKEEDLSKFSIGDSIHFNLTIEGNISYAHNFNIVEKLNIENVMEDDFWERDPYDPLEMGQYISDGTFLTLDSIEVSLSDFDEKYLFISYIFSRCPMPNMCPAVIVKNQYLAEKFSETNIQFILLSFDHIYDTPSILKDSYYNLDKRYENIIFVSSYGALDDLNLISRETGMSFWGINENDIGHIMRSVLISPEGKLLTAYDGLDWEVKDVEKNIKEILTLQ
tara:strand:- start:1081 stop:1881 length:801 start_codon:yes stop_codon:yes gene_type:complete